MFKLALPSARDVLLMRSVDGRADTFTLENIESIIGGSLSHIWFYLLDERLDGVPNGTRRFIYSIDQAMHTDLEDHSPKAMAYFSNYDHITQIIFTVANLMIENLNVVIRHCPELCNFSNTLSYLDYMDHTSLFITFFNKQFERDIYVRRISGH